MEEIKKLASELANTILYEGKNPLPEKVVKDNAKYLLDLIGGHVEPPTPTLEQQIAQTKLNELQQQQAQKTIDKLVENDDIETAIEKLTQVLETGTVTKDDKPTQTSP